MNAQVNLPELITEPVLRRRRVRCARTTTSTPKLFRWTYVADHLVASTMRDLLLRLRERSFEACEQVDDVGCLEDSIPLASDVALA